MSAQLAAKHLAAYGRGPDTTLVHMTPGEVASLQALAQQHGGSLSINPQTGLPEAGFLSALLPMAAGAGLAAMGMPAGYAALSVGAASAATNGGDLRKSLMVGISAYGGAGMAESFMGAGLGTMGGAMGAPAAAPTVLEVPPGGSSVYSLGSPATSSTAEYSLGASNSYLNKPEYFSLASAAPAQAAQAAAAATPAAQQAAALQSMDIGQRFDALKAGATGTNALNYIKANPFASLGTATAMLTPDETSTPQKAADTDRGPRAKLQYYPGWSSPLPAPNMQGIEQTYNRPYYAAKGGVTRMATGGITSAPRNQQQLFADYLQRVSSSGAATTTPPTNKYEWWKNPNDPAPAAPAETAEEYAARMRANARGGDGGGGKTAAEREAEANEPNAMFNGLSRNAYNALSPFERRAVDAQVAKDNPIQAGIGKMIKNAPSIMFLDALFGTPEPTEDPRYQAIVDADLDSRSIRDKSFESSIEGITASDAANAEMQRVTDEEANISRMKDVIAEQENIDRMNASPEARAEALRNSGLFGISPFDNDDSVGRGVFGYSLSDNNDSVGRGDFASGFGISPSDNNDSVGRGVFGYSLSDNNDSVGRGDFASGFGISPSDNNDSVGRNDFASGFGISRSDNFSPAAEAEARAAANTAATRAEQIDRINASFAATERVNREAEAKAADAAMERQTTLDKIARDADEAEKETANQAVLDAARAAADVPLGEGTVSPSSSSLPAGIDITPSVPGAIDASPNANKKSETLGIPNAETFAAMLGSPFAQTAALSTGIVSDTAPNMGIQGAGLGGFGGFGGFGISPSDNNDSIGRGSFDFGYGLSDNNDSVGRGDFGGDFGYSVSDNNDSVGRGDGASSGDYGGGAAADGGGRDSDGSPYARGGEIHGGLPNPYNLGSYSDGGRLLRGPGDGVSDSIPATIGKGRPARLADGEFVIPARIVSEIGNGSTEAGARKLYAMMDRIQAGRKKSVGKGKVAVNSRADRHLPA